MRTNDYAINVCLNDFVSRNTMIELILTRKRADTRTQSRLDKQRTATKVTKRRRCTTWPIAEYFRF